MAVALRSIIPSPNAMPESKRSHFSVESEQNIFVCCWSSVADANHDYDTEKAAPQQLVVFLWYFVM